MKKIYALFVALCTAFAVPVQADTTMTTEVVNNLSGYEIYKFYDFNAWTCNDVALGDWAVSTTAASFKVNKFNVYQVTSEGLTNFYVQDYSGKMYHRTDRAMGIININSGARSLTITDMHAGQILVFDGGQSQTYAWSDATVYNTDDVADITDSIHALQEEPDAFRYFQMLVDGQFQFSLPRACYINALAICQSATAEEFVSEPVAEVVTVDGVARELSVKPGESSKGNEVTTWYTVDGTAPLFLEDTDVILSADTVWNADSTAYELANITYVQRAVKNGDAWGENQYDGSSIRLDNNDDEDGDGIVELKIASVAEETGIASSIVTVEVGVGEIQLNAPTLTLVGMDGVKRGYQLGWESNLITDVDHSFVVQFDESEDDSYMEGDIVWASDMIVATVQAPGYTENSVTEADMAQPGVSYTRKGDLESLHNWDFVNISGDTLNRLKANIVDYYYVIDEAGDTLKYDDSNAPSDAIEHYAFWGWSYDSAKNRSWPWVYTDTLHTTASDGVTDSTYVNAYYAEDLSMLFDGLELDCAPYLSSSSTYQASYGIYTNGSGLYNMSKMTITIPSVAYGEYVLISSSNGYAFGMCENAEGGYSYDMARGAYTYYIDVYTSDDLPDGIGQLRPAADNPDAPVYDLSGRRVSRPTQRGIYIQNGRKFLVK